jgi:CubicO group peptidase (beta-lactamase class C family)
MRLRILVIIAMVFSLARVPGHSAQAETPPESRADLTGATPLPLTGKRRAEFEAYVADALNRFGVPGAAVAVVENGEIVYLNGFGVKESGSTRPVTPDTMMMIGSITKSMTTMLAASLVDHDRVTWETRLIDLLPGFAVGDPALTERLTVRDAFCNCSGVPGLNLESSFESGSLTLEKVVTALADVAPTARYGERFIYNNILIASGGYALGVANGGGAGNLGLAYDEALRERILGPIGMTHSRFDPEAVLADGDYALPHAVDLSGELRPLPLSAERGLLPYRPAGALWSNAREMARYLQTELARGVAPGGTRVVSAENLEATWAPGVSVPNLYGGPPEMAATMTHYGLGWLTGRYRGLRVVRHAGGSSGFSAEIAFLPEADLGIVILTNSLSLAPIPLAFQSAVEIRLFELLFDQPAEFDSRLMAQAEALAASRPPRSLGKLEPAAVAPYLGRYASAGLGEVSLSLRGDRLVLDAGELNSELRPLAAGGAETVYLLHDPPLSLFSEAYGATVSFSGGAQEPRMTITIPASVTGPEQVFVFTPRPA